MKNILPLLTLFSLLWAITPATAQIDSTFCLRLASPRPGSTLTTSVCTLKVEACAPLIWVRYSARYMDLHGLPVVAIINQTNTPPFSVIWNMDSVPNQLLEGATISCDAGFAKKTYGNQFLGTLFLAHHKIAIPDIELPFALDIFPKSKKPLITMTADSSLTNVSVYATWNKSGISIKAIVDDPLFNPATDKAQLANMGIELLLDTSANHSVIPGSSVFDLIFPLSGPAMFQKFRPVFDSTGKFHLDKTTITWPESFNCGPAKPQGFFVECIIPVSLFGNSLPHIFTANIVAQTLDERSNLVRISWAQKNGQNIYSPFTWGTIRLEPVPGYLQNRWLIGSCTFLAGLFAALLLGFIVIFVRRKWIKPQPNKQPSEADLQSLNLIQQTIEDCVTDKNFSIESLSLNAGLSAQQINRLFKKYMRRTFLSHLALSRIEIAKERLRSSRSSEAFIAASSGFDTVKQMQKLFWKYFKISPANFRKVNQIS